MEENTVEYLTTRKGGLGLTIEDQKYAKFNSVLVSREKLREGDIALLGIPFEGLTYNPVGGRGGPEGIRKGLGFYRPYSPELDVTIGEDIQVSDLGDIAVSPLSYDETFKRIDSVLKNVLEKRFVPIAFGGSHTITEGTVKAFSDFHNRNVGLLWFDAHPDTMEDYYGDKHYCGCPVLRIVEDGYVKPENVVILGVRSFHDSKGTIYKAKELGVNMIYMDDIREQGIEKNLRWALERVKDGTEAFYTTLDTDVIEGNFVPGTQAPCPNGYLPNEITKCVRQVALSGCAAFDVVELAPSLDVRDTTCLLMASLVLEMIAGVGKRKK